MHQKEDRMERYAAFDVETPNDMNNRMSSIGIALVEDGMIIDRFTSLIDPETYFSPFNQILTGITPEKVRNAPTFGELWKEMLPYFEGSILVAHSATFDLSVLGKCLRAYCIDWERYVPYLCTVRMGRAFRPNLVNHKLNTLCSECGIPLDHHKADSDSNACANLLIRYLQDGIDSKNFLRTYDLKSFRTLKKNELL